MFTAEIYQTATDDLQRSYDWYEEQVTGLGESFITEVDYYFELICKNPYQFQVQFSGKYHFALLKRLPFRVVYRIDEKKKIVYISSVFHTSRNPKGF